MMSLEQMSMKSRTARKLGPIDDIVLLALDPGETSGWCTFKGLELLECGQEQTNNMQEGATVYQSLLDCFGPQLVITEDYKIYATHLKQHEWSELLTPKLVGVVEVLCAQYKLPIHKEMAQRPKAFVDDDKLRAWKLYVPGKKHARDAIRHACFQLLFGRLLNEAVSKTEGAKRSSPT